jgi:hypothetical protein
LFGIRHRNSFFDGMTWDEIREWKREQQDKGMSPIVAQPAYEKIVLLGARRYGMTVRLADGRTVVHELLGRSRLDQPR